MGITRLRIREQSASIQFNNNPTINVNALFKLLQKKPLTYKLIKKTQLTIQFKGELCLDERLKRVDETLNVLAPTP